MKKSYDNKEDTRKKIEELRAILNKVYAEHGNIKEVVKISQQLDKFILIEQIRRLKVRKNSEEDDGQV